MKNGRMKVEVDRLVKAAAKAAKNAYAPYSGIRVGAAVTTASGRTYSGCNVENASYGLTICAERAAISAAVASEGARMRLLAIAVISNSRGPFGPCGACRQVISEFGPQALVIYRGKRGLRKQVAERLLPDTFALNGRKH